MDVIAGLIPSLVVLGFFIAILVTALRATDRRPGSRAADLQEPQAGRAAQRDEAPSREPDEDEPGPGGDRPAP